MWAREVGDLLLARFEKHPQSTSGVVQKCGSTFGEIYFAFGSTLVEAPVCVITLGSILGHSGGHFGVTLTGLQAGPELLN